MSHWMVDTQMQEKHGSLSEKRASGTDRRATGVRKPFVAPRLIHCGELERITMASVPGGE